MKFFIRPIALLLVIVIVLGSSASVYASESSTSWPSGNSLDLTAESAIVMEASTGAILYSKNIDTEEYPASITKIMTVLLALENCTLDETVTFSDNAVYGIDSGSSNIARNSGEKMTMEECLYAIMLESANEVAAAVAEHVAGSIDEFADMMNEKAEELGCTDTHFTNPHGLPDEDHYTTAHDMALIAQAAFQNETFREIISSRSYTIPVTNKCDEPYCLANHHKMIQPSSEWYYEYCLGGKTGYTTVAQSTLVTYAEKDGMDLICVVLKATPSTGHYQDTIKLFNYCFDNFALFNISDNDSRFIQSGSSSTFTGDNIFGDIGSFISVNKDDNIVLPTDADFSDAVPTLQNDSDSSDVLATLSYTYDNNFVGSTDVKLVDNTTSDTEKIFTSGQTSDISSTNSNNFFTINIKKIIVTIIVIILILFMLLFILRHFIIRRKRYLRERRRNRRRRY